MRYGYTLAAAAFAALLSSTSAHAVLVADGITYTLTEADIAGQPLTDRFTLTITGINAAADTEGGRSGVNAIAFNKPVGFTSAVMVTPPTGYNFVLGGLNSSGCDGSGNFFCFDNAAIPPTPTTALATNSSLTFVFDVSTTTGNFAGYNPGFKIDWVGTQNNYDLVSKVIGVNNEPPGDCPDCTPTPNATVPEPASLALLAGMIGSGAVSGGLVAIRRRRHNHPAV